MLSRTIPALVVTLWALAPRAAGQIVYQSQQRRVHTTDATSSAPDFGPFEQTLSYSHPLGCVFEPGTSASATHASILAPSSMWFSMTASARFQGAWSDFSVTFTAPAGSEFRLDGERRQRQAPVCCGTATVRLFGPGVDFTAQPDVFQTDDPIAYSASGVLPGGVDVLQALASAGSICYLGSPTLGVADASASFVLLPPRCNPDADRNGQVTPSDVAYFVGVWFSSLASGTLAGDFDRNGTVEPADLALFVQAWMAAMSGAPLPC